MSELPEVAEVMQRDRHRLMQWRRKLRSKNLGTAAKGGESNRAAGDRTAADETAFIQALRESQDRVVRRRSGLPKPNLDTSLPIHEQLDVIQDALRSSPVVVLAGETGSGKSTQLPLMALQLQYGVRGLIGHTQPRRIAARSVAERLAQQLGEPLGKSVGFKVRFQDVTTPETYIKVMTDGILLAETQTDRFLDAYEMLIIDEAHERSLNIDFLLGIVHRVLSRRPDFRVVVTSATIDTQRFADYFQSVVSTPIPVLQVPGRTYPVDIFYEASSEDELGRTHERVVQQCRELARRRDGDVLVFLPTEVDIRLVAKKLRGELSGNGYDILPLYARLSPQQQSEIFRPHSRGRVVLATNVAESSITVPGIRYVVDTGTARISRFAPRTKVQRLPVEPISQASANQRAGRCGRVGPGECYRLYSSEDFLARPEFTTPEIRRTNLAGTLLQLLALGFSDVEQFPFLDPPSSDQIREGFHTLFELQAIDSERRLTPLGRQLSRLPVDPRVGRMLFAAQEAGCLPEVLIIAAGLEVPDPRVRPAEKQAAADTAHQQWNDPQSDFLAILKLWDFVHQLKEQLSRNRFRTALEQNFLSPALVLQWQDIHRQLLGMAAEHGLRGRERQGDYGAIHRSLLTGLLSSIAMREERREYLGAGGVRFVLWPGSGIQGTPPAWVMAAEIVETTRRFGRTVAAIDPAWIEPLAEHLVKRQQFDPYWSEKQETVMGYQNTTLFGLPIRTRQRISYTRVDPEVSRRMFIDEGLVAGNLRTELGFWRYNQTFTAQIAELANKTRQRNLVLDTYQVSQFYHRRIPPEAVDMRSLREWLRSDPTREDSLKMSWADLGLDEEVATAARDLPDEVAVGSLQLPVDYVFQPGAEHDGANIRVPLEAVGQLDDVQLGWLIPGLVRERIVDLIRSLPKPLRRNLVPAPNVAAELAQRIPWGQGNFLEVVARELTMRAGELIRTADFVRERFSQHLWVMVHVEKDGQVIAQGRSVAELRGQLGTQAGPGHLSVAASPWDQTAVTDWTWEELPAVWEVERGATRLQVYPALVEEGQQVALRLIDTESRAQWLTQGGLRRLLATKHHKAIRSQVQWLPQLEQHKVALARWVNPADFMQWLPLRMAEIAFLGPRSEIRTRAQFEQLQKTAVERLSIAAQELAAWLPKLSAAAQALALALEQQPAKIRGTRDDLRPQWQRLFETETWHSVPWKWLQHYPRYLQAGVVRLQKAGSWPATQIQQWEQLLQGYWVQFTELRERHQQQGWFDPELENFRWMIEELRVSKFAQQLGTSLTVSEKRMEKQWQSVRKL